MDILKALNDKRKEYQQQINTIDAAIKLFIGEVAIRKKRTVSAAAKRKMSLAAKKRWAEKKKAK